MYTEATFYEFPENDIDKEKQGPYTLHFTQGGDEITPIRDIKEYLTFTIPNLNSIKENDKIMLEIWKVYAEGETICCKELGESLQYADLKLCDHDDDCNCKRDTCPFHEDNIILLNNKNIMEPIRELFSLISEDKIIEEVCGSARGGDCYENFWKKITISNT